MISRDEIFSPIATQMGAGEFLGKIVFVTGVTCLNLGISGDRNLPMHGAKELLRRDRKGYGPRSGACCERRAGDGRQCPADGIDLVA